MILTPSRSVRVWAYPAPVDLRKGYDGLYGLVEQGLKRNPMDGDLFLFVNDSRKLCKVLVWTAPGSASSRSGLLAAASRSYGVTTIRSCG